MQAHLMVLVRFQTAHPAAGQLPASNNPRPAERPRPCRVFSPCRLDQFAHAAAAAMARELCWGDSLDEDLRLVLRAAAFDLLHRGFRVPDDLDPALKEVCGMLMDEVGEE
jgi:hypothetical protein